MENFILNALPSIRESISVQYTGQPRNRIVNKTDSDDDEIHYDSADADFSFGISTVDSCKNTLDVATADAIFHHGHILPLYSVSNRNCFSKDDADTDIDASLIPAEVANGTFDVPKTAPESPIKSWSTGTTRRESTIREFLFGGRSRSNGKEKLEFLETGTLNINAKKKKNNNKGKRKHKDKESKDSNKQNYTKNDGETGIIVKARRRSFFPYFRFFGGCSMHGFANKFFP